MPSSIWLVPLNTIPSRSICVVTDGKTSFLFTVELYSTVHMYHFFFIHSYIDGYITCFHVLAFVNNVTVDTWMHIYFFYLVFWVSFDQYPVIELLYPSMSLVIIFVLKFILSDVNWYPDFFKFPFSWNIFFYPFTFSLYRHFNLKWVSCRQHVYRICFVIHSDNVCLLIGAFNPFAFKVVVDRYVFIAIFFFFMWFLIILNWWWWTPLAFSCLEALCLSFDSKW